MSKKYEKVKNYYDKGLWNENRVHNAVGKWITSEEIRADHRESIHRRCGCLMRQTDNYELYFWK